MLANKLVSCIVVNRVTFPPAIGTDHQSEGTVCASAICTPSTLSSQVGAEDCCGLIALKRMDWPSGESMGASIISGVHEPVRVTSCAPLPSAFARNILFFPVLGSIEI